MASGASHVIQSLIANAVIAVAKGVAALFTGSGAMLAETMHSFADCGNQLLLLLGINRSKKAPDARHPLGYGRALYFWSFMVALLLFVGGGVYSVYEGVHKIVHPEEPDKVWLGLLILGFSLLVEGWATIGNIRELNKRRGAKPFFRFLRDTKDSDLVVVFGENAAAVLGLALAMVALGVGYLTHDGRWDGIGSLAIGAVLLGVALFLAAEVQGLLLGESADPEITDTARAITDEDPRIDEVISIMTLQQGPGEVMVAVKLRCKSGLTSDEVCHLINDFEAKLRAQRPEVKWSFVEPDLGHAVAKASL
jgi:cation diffusion facilitator family transporter